MTQDDAFKAEFVLSSIEMHAALQEVVGDWLPDTQTARLNEVVEHWRDPLDAALIRLTLEGGSRKDWLDVVREGTQSVRDGLTACHYHVSRIVQIENEILDFCEKRGELFREGVDTNFRIPSLSAEYAALQFALRRTLDYLAKTVGAFFKTDGGSFRRLGKTIEGRQPVENAEAILNRLASTDLSSILGTDEGHSVRDQLAHHQVVEAAWFGVQRVDGDLKVRYSSEVEDIEQDSFLTTPHRGRDLSMSVAAKLAFVEDAIFGCYVDLGLLGPS